MEVRNANDMREYLKNGISGDIFKKFGCYSCHFRPFKVSHTHEEQIVIDFVSDDDVDDCEDIKVDKQVLFSLMEANISTVFNGYRFFFEDYERLEMFCKIVETQEGK